MHRKQAGGLLFVENPPDTFCQSLPPSYFYGAFCANRSINRVLSFYVLSLCHQVHPFFEDRDHAFPLKMPNFKALSNKK